MDIEKLRNLCLAFPFVEEDVKWGNDLCFLIGKKMFCATALEGEFSCSMKVLDEEFEELIARNDIILAPYLGRYKWILVKSGDAFNEKEWLHYLNQSYQLIRSKLSKKIRSELK
jgi:predicted DNA-binding protein (MmcQ/YjbR family)